MIRLMIPAAESRKVPAKKRFFDIKITWLLFCQYMHKTSLTDRFLSAKV